MKWYWYAARPDEMFLDLDSPAKQRRALRVLKMALGTSWDRLVNSQRNDLEVSQVYMVPSLTKGHVHAVVRTKHAMAPLVKVSWSLWMGGDPLRSAYAIERFRAGLTIQELIAAPAGPFLAYRDIDAICECDGKHKEERITKKCPALLKLLGKEHAAADYFPRVRNERKNLGPLIIEWGRVPLSRIRRWENPKWTKNKLTSI